MASLWTLFLLAASMCTTLGEPTLRVHVSGYCNDIGGPGTLDLFNLKLGLLDSPESGGYCNATFQYEGKSSCNVSSTYFEISSGLGAYFPPGSRVTIKEFRKRKDLCSSTETEMTKYEIVRFNTTNPTLLSSMNVKTNGPEFSIEIVSNGTAGFLDVIQRPYRLPTEKNDCTCPKNFAQFRCYCYSVHSALQKGVTSWVSAEQACSTLTSGGHLVSIVDSEEMVTIQHFMKSLWWEIIEEMEWILIGLVDKNKNMAFEWSDGSPVPYRDWYHPAFESWLPSIVPNGILVDTAQPSSNPESKCGLMLVNKQNLLDRSNWFLIPCDGIMNPLGLAFMCKVPAERNTKNVTELKPHLAVKSPLETAVCDDSWTMLNGTCYKMTQIKRNRTFVEANSKCLKLLGAKLAELDQVRLNRLLLTWRFRFSDGTPMFREVNLGVSESNYFATDEYKNMLRLYLKVRSDQGFPEKSRKTLVICERPVNKTRVKCKESLFQCHDGLCISKMYVADGVVNCAKEEDELAGLTPLWEGSKSPVERRTIGNYTKFPMFNCNDGDNIMYSFYCDSVQHCKDGSDETDCVYPPCLSRHFRCNNGQCIPEMKRCDSMHQCLDSSDEKNCIKCNGTCRSAHCTRNSYSPECARRKSNRYFLERVLVQRACVPESAKCHVMESSCFTRNLTCIYDLDYAGRLVGCKDGSHLRFCKDFECPGMYKCRDTYCIPVRRVCDGTRDCPTGEDEADCENYMCQPGYFRCHGQKNCLPQGIVCDGVYDCPEQDDERLCWSPSCPARCECSGLIAMCSAEAKLDDIPEDFRAIALRWNRQGWQHEAFLHRHHLGWLDLARNKLKLVPLLNQLMNLRYLDLSDNEISFLGAYVFQGLVNLRTLNLAGNKITEISTSSFTGFFVIGVGPKKTFEEFSKDTNLRYYGLPGLRHLDLSRNKLVNVHERPFDDSRNLSYLDIRQNDLNPIDPRVFRFVHLDWLHADDFSHCCAARQRVKNCSRLSDEFSSCEDLISRQELQITMWVLGFFSVLGNLVVICIRWRRRKDNTVERALVINLGVSNLLMGFYQIIISSVNVYFRGVYFAYHIPWRNSLLCTIAGVLSFVSSEMSVFTLVFITCGRTVAIVHPFRRRWTSRWSLTVVLLIAWGATVTFALLPVIFKDGFGNFYGRNGVCVPFSVAQDRQSTVKHDIYNAMFLVVNLIAFIVIVTGYVAVYSSIRKSSKIAKMFRKSKAENKGLLFMKKMTLVIFTDFVCWMSVIFIRFLEYGGFQISPIVSAWVTVFVLPVNAALNPFLYIHDMAGCLCKRCMRKKKSVESIKKVKTAGRG